MTSERISVSVSDGFFDAYLSLPPQEEGPGVLVIPEIFGVNEHIRSIADKIAAEGYVVLVPDLFWRMKPNIELGYEGDDLKTALNFYERFDENEGMSDLRHAANALRNNKACTGRIGSIGFCLGGKLTFRLSAQTNLNVAISYYGGKTEKHLAEADKIKCQLMMHFGDQDDSIPEKAFNQIKEALDIKPNVTIYRYEGVGHGFNCDARASYDKDAAELAWSRSIELLNKELKS